MWLAKPLYESLPAALIAAGLLALLSALYVDRWIWAELMVGTGLVFVVTGLVLVLRRRGYRASRSRLKFEDTR